MVFKKLLKISSSLVINKSLIGLRKQKRIKAKTCNNDTVFNKIIEEHNEISLKKRRTLKLKCRINLGGENF